MTNEERLLQQLHPEMARIWKAVKTLTEQYNGTGDIEIHMYKGQIRVKHGIYIKPAWTDEQEYVTSVQKEEK